MSRFRTPLYTTDDLLGALRSADAATLSAYQAAYARWLATRPARSEPSRGIIVKRLGAGAPPCSWPGRRAAARPGGRAARPARTGRTAAEASPAGRQYTDEELEASLRAAAVVTGGPR